MAQSLICDMVETLYQTEKLEWSLEMLSIM